MFRRGLKEGKIAREEGGYKSSIVHDVLLAEIRQGCRTDVSRGGRVSKEEIARYRTIS